MDKVYTTKEVLEFFTGRKIVVFMECAEQVYFKVEVECYPEDFISKENMLTFEKNDKALTLLSSEEYKMSKLGVFFSLTDENKPFAPYISISLAK